MRLFNRDKAHVQNLTQAADKMVTKWSILEHIMTAN